MQNTTNSSHQSEGESILFYGKFASISLDTHMRGGAIDSSLLLHAVEEHKDDTSLTVMDTDYISLSTELKNEVIEINPNTQFIQVTTLREFTEYYDRGMDRELHPVESVTTIDSVMFYDTLEKEQPEVKVEVEKPREYLKATELSSNEMMKDLNGELTKVVKLEPQEFLDFMGLKGYNAEKDGLMIAVAQENLKNEFFQKYALPQAGKTAVESIEKVIPSMPAKSIKDAVLDGVEFVSDIVGDTDRGHLVIEYDCTSLSDCHIKGVYREYEDTKEASSETTNEKIENKIELDESGKAIYEHESNIVVENEQTNTQPFDSTAKAQEILETANLNDFSQANENDYVMEME